MEIIELKVGKGSVRGYLHDDHEVMVRHRIRPALIVCPGGGYGHLSPREADPPAMEFFALGYQVFILSYSLMTPGPVPQLELAQTVATVRENCAQWRLDPDKVAVMGFSAGGHLVASLGALCSRKEMGFPENCRPDALVLCYPVITMGDLTHQGTRDAITGGAPHLLELMSVENQVTADFPPTFLWHTMEDGAVPVENSMLLAWQLRKYGVPFECHIFTPGAHGLSTCNVEVETPNSACRSWLELCKTWLNDRFTFVP